MKFTERLSIETKESHKIIDRHQFVNLIRKDNIAAKLYINFNKVCIYELQLVLKLEDTILQSKLHRYIQQPLEIQLNKHLDKLLVSCKKFPLETEYMFKVGLIMGGNLLKKYVSTKDHNFLHFEDSKELFNELKCYLNKHVKNEELFIKNVNDIYVLIQLCFDEFYLKF